MLTPSECCLFCRNEKSCIGRKFIRFLFNTNYTLLPEGKHYGDILPGDHYLTIKYSFESSLGATENCRYKQSVLGRIPLQDEADNDLEEIGRFYLAPLLFGLGMNQGRDHFSNFDTEEYLMELGRAVWDFKADGFKKPLLEFFEHDLIESDVLFTHTVEILPAYRGMQIGEHAMKDAANNFEHGCSLIVTDCHCNTPLGKRSIRNGKRKYNISCLKTASARPKSG